MDDVDYTSLTSSFFTVEYLTKPHVMLLGLAAVLSVLCIYYRVVYAPYQVFKVMGVEGPQPQPIWGNTLLYKRLGEKKMFEHLHCVYGAVCGFYLGEKPYLLVVDLKMLKEILVDAAENFSTCDDKDSAFGIHGRPPSLLPCVGKEWQRFRDIFTAAFSPAKLMTMAPLLENIHKRLLETLNKAETSEDSIEMWSLCCSVSLEALCCQLEEKAVFLKRGENKLTNAIKLFFQSTTHAEGENVQLNTVGVWNIITTALMSLRRLGKRIEAHNEFKNITEAVSEIVGQYRDQQNKIQRQESEKRNVKPGKLQRRFTAPPLSYPMKLLPPKSFLRVLVEGLRSKNLTDADVVSCCVIFLLAGYETIASTLAHTCYVLALNNLLQEKLCATIDAYFKRNPMVTLFNASEEIEYLDMIVQESLRLHPPTSKIIRHCVEPCVVRGVSFAPGTRVIVPLDLIHRLSDQWEEPDQFKPERMRQAPDEFCHMPFGEGPQHCVGMEFALMVVKITLIEILRVYKFIKAPNTQVPLQSKEGSTRKPTSGIYLRIKKRSIYKYSVVTGV